MLTKKQANRLRGQMINLLAMAHEHAFAGSMAPTDAHHIRTEYERTKREVLDSILALVENKL